MGSKCWKRSHKLLNLPAPVWSQGPLLSYFLCKEEWRLFPTHYNSLIGENVQPKLVDLREEAEDNKQLNCKPEKQFLYLQSPHKSSYSPLRLFSILLVYDQSAAHRRNSPWGPRQGLRIWCLCADLHLVLYWWRRAVSLKEQAFSARTNIWFTNHRIIEL